MTRTEREIELEAKVIAQERVIIWLARLMLVGRTAEQKAAMKKHAVESMRAGTYPDLDPAQSDHLAAEVEAAVERLMDEIT